MLHATSVLGFRRHNHHYHQHQEHQQQQPVGSPVSCFVRPCQERPAGVSVRLSLSVPWPQAVALRATLAEVEQAKGELAAAGGGLEQELKRHADRGSVLGSELAACREELAALKAADRARSVSPRKTHILRFLPLPSASP